MEGEMWAVWLGIALIAGQLQPQRPARPVELDPDFQEEETGEPEYSFNPIQAAREVEVGNFYYKKGSYKAAAGRYERATKWQPDLAEAYYKLGQAREKLKQWQHAVEAYRKFLETPESEKRAAEVKRKISQLEKKIPKTDAASSRPPASVP